MYFVKVVGTTVPKFQLLSARIVEFHLYYMFIPLLPFFIYKIDIYFYINYSFYV